MSTGKRILTVFLIVLIVASLAGCGTNSPTSSYSGSEGGIAKIVADISAIVSNSFNVFSGNKTSTAGGSVNVNCNVGGSVASGSCNGSITAY